MVRWLRLHAPNAEGLGSIPGRKTRSRMLQLKILCATAKIPCIKINQYFKIFILCDFFFLQLHKGKDKQWEVAGIVTTRSCLFPRSLHGWLLPSGCYLPGSLPWPPVWTTSQLLAFLTLLLCFILLHSTSVFSLVYYLSPTLRCKLNEKELFSLHLYPSARTVVAHSGHINSCRL